MIRTRRSGKVELGVAAIQPEQRKYLVKKDSHIQDAHEYSLAKARK